MLKKLLVRVLAWGVVLLLAALLAVPAFAQVASPTLTWGSDEFLINEFANLDGDITPFCKSVLPASQQGWMNLYPNLAGLCGWSS